MDQTRSSGLIAGVRAALILGAICTLAFPLITVRAQNAYYTYHASYSWRATLALLRQDGKDWLDWLALVGFGAAYASTAMRGRAERVRQAAWLTASVFVMLWLPIYLESQVAHANWALRTLSVAGAS